MTSLKGPGEAQVHDGSKLRIAIVHARWNTTIISALVAGARKSLLAFGVREENIVVQDVPGSYELPLAVSRMYTASQVESSNNTISSATSAVTDLLSSTSLADLASPQQSEKDPSNPSNAPLIQPFSAMIAIGVLIKGETMHFEYIADATSHGLMRVQLDLGVPVIFGLLTVLDEEQGKARAGLVEGGHCHGEDWGRAAVELGVKRVGWGEGKFL
ncbi:hypothetical protein N7G274_001520 [Stereocaulon virgatum]|uniref:6,7-dimethyl-8-ribityllumazine synthase n=1 Tax=Stereocaulon virgatum TaxID=373712 RepID=A0ABR4ARG9_9LECA